MVFGQSRWTFYIVFRLVKNGGGIRLEVIGVCDPVLFVLKVIYGR